MLTKEVFKKEMERINVLYPRWGVDITCKFSMRTWYEQLNNMSDQEFSIMVNNHIKFEERNPTVASLLKFKK